MSLEGTGQEERRLATQPLKNRALKDISMAKKLIIALGVAAITLTATACNTVKGVGRDIESVGQAGDRAT